VISPKFRGWKVFTQFKKKNLMPLSSPCCCKHPWTFWHTPSHCLSAFLNETDLCCSSTLLSCSFNYDW
jgi:hypothetical protein